MLLNLHVKNLALIDEVEVDFSKGLNILTGETGAGKSIVLGSISLALGGKYSPEMLREGAQFGLVELTFDISNNETLRKLEELEVFPEEHQLVISRKLMEGRSISRVNGETISISKLREIGEILIDIHGQHEHQSLLHKKNHLLILDRFSKEILLLKKAVRQSYQEYRTIQKQLQEATTDESERLKEMSFLEFEIDEIRNANLSVTETEELEQSYRQMLKGKKISDHIEESYSYISGASDSTVSELVGRSVRSMALVAQQDERAKELYEQLMEVENLLNDFKYELRDYLDEISFSPEVFYETENRLNEINHLKAKYGNEIDDIFAYCEDKENRLSVLKNYDSYLEDLRNNLIKAESNLSQQCQKLSELRKKEGRLLQDQIVKGLQDLNFLDVNFEIQFLKTDDFTSEGIDDVEFRISMNPGQPLRALGDVASGGELSRIMLAIKSVMADKDEIETLIFDEIDVGISGRTAQKVSEKMGWIGLQHQVICITHLAQIAAMADAHYEIKKSVVDGKTLTEIQKLEDKQSILELARILGGAEITSTVIESAKEMKKMATCLKTP